jgi:hypothetical protein
MEAESETAAAVNNVLGGSAGTRGALREPVVRAKPTKAICGQLRKT